MSEIEVWHSEYPLRQFIDMASRWAIDAVYKNRTEQNPYSVFKHFIEEARENYELFRTQLNRKLTENENWRAIGIDLKHRFLIEIDSYINWYNEHAEELEKFEPYIIHRFGNIPELHAETLYTYDRSTYALGPHTDSVKKVLTLLIYLPEDASLSHLGTSMYTPLDPTFTCDGGPHHKFHRFKLLKTAQYKPNSLFGFFKTNNSFHGVEPIKENIRRDLLIYDVQVVKH